MSLTVAQGRLVLRVGCLLVSKCELVRHELDGGIIKTSAQGSVVCQSQRVDSAVMSWAVARGKLALGAWLNK